MAVRGWETTGQDVISGQDLHGKRVIVTGASSGLGAETALLLAQTGAQIVLAVRNRAAGEQVAQSIGQQTGQIPHVEELDLASLDSVRAFAQRIGSQSIDILINNAGLMATPYGRTADGFEMQIGVNHFGHFLLTQLLLPNLLASSRPRVVQLSSAGHIWSDVNLDDLHFEHRTYDPWLSYGQSKTANILFAVELTRRYAAKGLYANAVMPGRIAGTGLTRHTTEEVLRGIPAISAGAPPADAPANNFPKSLAQGVATTLWAAIAPELEGRGGLYCEDCQVAEAWNESHPRRGVKDYALDPVSALRLWQITEDAVSLH